MEKKHSAKNKESTKSLKNASNQCLLKGISKGKTNQQKNKDSTQNHKNVSNQYFLNKKNLERKKQT